VSQMQRGRAPGASTAATRQLPPGWLRSCLIRICYGRHVPSRRLRPLRHPGIVRRAAAASLEGRSAAAPSCDERRRHGRPFVWRRALRTDSSRIGISRRGSSTASIALVVGSASFVFVPLDASRACAAQLVLRHGLEHATHLHVRFCNHRTLRRKLLVQFGVFEDCRKGHRRREHFRACRLPFQRATHGLDASVRREAPRDCAAHRPHYGRWPRIGA
jgi:hypothetical protein